MKIKKMCLITIVLILMVITLIGCNQNAENNGQEMNKTQSENQNENLINDNENQSESQNEILINDNANQEEQDKKENFEEKTTKIDGVKQVGDIEISNIQITLIEENKCRFTADVKNTSDKYLEPTSLDIKVINENGEVEEIFGSVVTELIWYETNTLTTYVLKDITDAKDIEFSIVEL